MLSTLVLWVKSKHDTRKRTIKSGIYIPVILLVFLLLLSAGNANAVSTDSISSSESTISSMHDEDNDGLTDEEEADLGTEEDNYYGDKDGDGLYDFEEVLDIYGNNDKDNPKYEYDNNVSESNVLDAYDLLGLDVNKSGVIRRRLSSHTGNGGFTDKLLWGVTFSVDYAGGSELGTVNYVNNVLVNVSFTGDYAGGSDEGNVLYKDNTLENVSFSGSFYVGGSDSGTVTYMNNTMKNVSFSGQQHPGGSQNAAVTYVNNTLENVSFSGGVAGGSLFAPVKYKDNVLKNVSFSGGTAGGSQSGAVTYENNTLTDVNFTKTYSGGGRDRTVNYTKNTLEDVIFSGFHAGGSGVSGAVVYTENKLKNVRFTGKDAGVSEGGTTYIGNEFDNVQFPADGTPADWMAILMNNNISNDNYDNDTDTLGDLEEFFVYFSNPTHNDTDRDKLLDNDEVNNLGTNPANNDTDGDGLNDSYELNDLTTNATSNDTDGDGLNDGWEVQYAGTSGVNIKTPASLAELASDEDMDGLNLSREGYFMTNASNNDTDDDGLNDGWEGQYNGSSGVNPLIQATGDELASDEDMDGLNLSREEYFMTNPAKNDTDGDGLGDEWEVQHDGASGVNPLIKADSTEKISDEDMDGLNLIEEGKSLTDPTDNDTDDDGLSDGWEEQYNGTSGINPLIKADITQLAFDNDTDGLNLSREEQFMTDPTDNDTDDDGLNDSYEVTLGTDPTDSDTDGDGLNDSYELTLGTNASNSDTDGDGLNDSYELTLGTNASNSDTDGDKLSDGWEVQYNGAPGVNPLMKASFEELTTDTDGDGLNLLEEAAANTDPEVDNNPRNMTTASTMMSDTAETSTSSTSSTEEGGSLSFSLYISVFVLFTMIILVFRMRKQKKA